MNHAMSPRTAVVVSTHRVIDTNRMHDLKSEEGRLTIEFDDEQK